LTMVYLDTSAFVKAAAEEPETPALRADLRSRERWTSSALLSVESRRACARIGRRAMQGAEDGLQYVTLIAVDDAVLAAAVAVEPASLSSADAIHLATAQSLGPELDAFYTYDKRLAEAARKAGLTVRSPR